MEEAIIINTQYLIMQFNSDDFLLASIVEEKNIYKRFV